MQVSKDIKCFDGFVRGDYLFAKEKYSSYDDVFIFTNENLSKFFSDIRVGKKALSVLAGGDQVFDLVLKGYTQIDTFDINRLTEYFALGFKKCAIENLSYEEFFSLFSAPYVSNKKTIVELINTMPLKYRNFWINYLQRFEDVLDKKVVSISSLTNSINKQSCFHDLLSVQTRIDDVINSVQYLSSKDAFDSLKSKLANAKISFEAGNLIDLGFRELYDFIYLSNIPQSFTQDDILFIMNNLIERNLIDDGQIALTFNFFMEAFPSELLDRISNYLYSGMWNFAVLEKDESRVRSKIYE